MQVELQQENEALRAKIAAIEKKELVVANRVAVRHASG